MAISSEYTCLVKIRTPMLKHLPSPIKFLNTGSSIILLYTTVHLISVRCHIRVDAKRICVNISDLIFEIINLAENLINKTNKCFWILTFIGPCIVIYSYNKSQPDALFLKFILVKNSTCFGQTYCPSSGVLILSSILTSLAARQHN